MYLDKIKAGNAKKLLARMAKKPLSLNILAQEIREFLIQTIADTGGHLASNLGVVELTVALHAVFDTPADKIIWDVGHQSYIHKILTGRKEGFAALRTMDGLSGFPKQRESEHDAFGTGHSSTAISAALGLAVARDLQGGNEAVIAVVGDGSITGGLAYEGLNNAGRANTDLLVILNDNEMSISKNVGAVSKHLNKLRTASAYLGVKESVHSIFDKLPIIGEKLTKGVETAKSMLKYAVIQGVLFEEMGFRYIGPVDGHDIPALLHVLRQVRKIKGPVLLHVLTTKGKGYEIAEQEPYKYHGVGKFNIETGEPILDNAAPSYTDVFSKHLIRKARSDEKIVAITAAMPDGTGLYAFKERFPKRFFDVGIAEGHAVTFAAGLAAGGLKPVFAVYSSFLQRGYDNIIHDVAVQNLPVVFAVCHAGAVDKDGETHQGVFDMAYLSHIPNLTVLAPSSAAQLRDMLDFALGHDAPVAIRYPKAAAPEGGGGIKFSVLQNGGETAIVSVGDMLGTARETARLLSQNGIEVSLIDSPMVKPIDQNLTKFLHGFKYVFTIEDGIKNGGFGERLANMISPAIFRAFAFDDTFPQTGTRSELFTRHGLDAQNICNEIIKNLKGQ